MKKILFKTAVISLFLALAGPFGAFAAEPSLESTSEINWITRRFTSNLSLDTKKAGLEMPSGKKKASALIKSKMSQLIQPPLLALYTDSSSTLEDYVINEELSLDEVYYFIMNGYKTPDVFTPDAATLYSANTLEIDKLGQNLVKHKYGYSPEEPIDLVPSRAYSGIIIDARGALPVHGEFISEQTNACFFPTIWDENMNVIYEKNSADPQIVIDTGLVAYDYSNNTDRYASRIGTDPLYIRATEVYGINRTDPVIKRSDALKILTIPENVELLKQGKVVILLDQEKLVYNIATPEKDRTYYAKFEAVKQYMYENVIPDVEFTDSDGGFKFAINLNFYPDSPVLLPGEIARLQQIADILKEILIDDGYTILVEGHTADVGKPVGQLNLSIERTRTVRDVLIDEGLDPAIFTYKAYGGTMPIASNDTEEGRAQNRRVYITARPRATYIQRDW
ncbi:MAG: OmpA family protein [Treponema sp.]|nr:OmpA family protein [Treponema sp.]